MNIGSLFSRHAQYRPNHLAIVFKDQRLTWLELNQNINRLANALLGMGIQKGDKVATLLPNCLELLEVYWAVAKIGAVVVPLSTMLLVQDGTRHGPLSGRDSPGTGVTRQHACRRTGHGETRRQRRRWRCRPFDSCPITAAPLRWPWWPGSGASS